MEALKYDNNKIPWDLMPTYAVEGMLTILAYGARKYSVCLDCKDEKGKPTKIYSNPRLDGDPERSDCPVCGSKNLYMGSHNWRSGFKWSRIISSTYRHLAEIMKGELIDNESGYPHAWHLMCNVAFIAEHHMFSLGSNDLFKYTREQLEKWKG